MTIELWRNGNWHAEIELEEADGKYKYGYSLSLSDRGVGCPVWFDADSREDAIKKASAKIIAHAGDHPLTPTIKAALMPDQMEFAL